MEKTMKKLFLLIITIMLIPSLHSYYHHYGRGGYRRDWAGPVIAGTAMAGLTAAAIASSNRNPQTVVIEEQPKPKKRIKRSAKKEIRHLKKQIKKLIKDNKQLGAMVKELQDENTSLKGLQLNQKIVS